MTLCAVICEYNPLTFGHLFQIDEIHRHLGKEAALVAVLSAGAVQRGDVPVLSLSARAELALLAGHDAVFALPATWACGCAEQFARAGVSIAARVGATHLAFGCETADLAVLQTLADLPRPDVRHTTLARHYPSTAPALAHHFTPNNILAIEYLRALRDHPHIIPLPILRRGSAHDSTGSASDCRRQIFAGKNLNLPFAEVLHREQQCGRAPISLLCAERAVFGQLRAMSPCDFRALPDSCAELAQRLHHACQTTHTIDALVDAVATKHLTRARVRRAVVAAFLGLTPPTTDPYLHPVALGQRGAAVLSRVNAPLITRPAKHKAILQTEAQAVDRLALCMPQIGIQGEFWRTKLVELHK